MLTCPKYYMWAGCPNYDLQGAAFGRFRQFKVLKLLAIK
jgi:hypothetical protein